MEYVNVPEQKTQLCLKWHVIVIRKHHQTDDFCSPSTILLSHVPPTQKCRASNYHPQSITTDEESHWLSKYRVPQLRPLAQRWNKHCVCAFVLKKRKLQVEPREQIRENCTWWVQREDLRESLITDYPGERKKHLSLAYSSWWFEVNTHTQKFWCHDMLFR